MKTNSFQVELSDIQVDRLAESIKEHMYADQGFMWDVARFYASLFSLNDYKEWFQEPDPWEEFTLPLSFLEKADQEEVE